MLLLWFCKGCCNDNQSGRKIKFLCPVQKNVGISWLSDLTFEFSLKNKIFLTPTTRKKLVDVGDHIQISPSTVTVKCDRSQDRGENWGTPPINILQYTTAICLLSIQGRINHPGHLVIEGENSGIVRHYTHQSPHVHKFTQLSIPLAALR